MEFERINGQVAVAEKKLNTFDKVVGEWRLKCEDLSAELDNSQRECRNQSSELFRLRAAWDEAVEQLDSVRRYNNLDKIQHLTLTFIYVDLLLIIPLFIICISNI